MAALTRLQIKTDVRSRIHDPNGRYVTDSEMDAFLDRVVEDIFASCPFEKKSVTVFGSTHLDPATYATLGTTVNYYAFPADFMALDSKFGMYVNGIFQHPADEDEVFPFQEKAVLSDDDAVQTAALDVSQYFNESQSGNILHYSIDWILADVMGAGGAAPRGIVFSFLKNPADTDPITYRYYTLPTLYTTDASTSNMFVAFQEVLVYGVKLRCDEKRHGDGEITFDVFRSTQQSYEVKKAEMKAFFGEPVKQRQHFMKTARQTHGRYNSSGYSRFGGSSSLNDS